MGKFGVAVIGASNRSQMIFRYLQKNSEEGYIAGVYDLIPERGEYLADHFETDDASIYESMEEAVSDDRVNAVFIGTPDGEHVEPVLASLEAGKHVYCEKPLAITQEGCDRIVEGARNADSVFYLGMNLRHSPVHEKLHDILDSGRLGKVLTIEANEYYYGGRTYFRRWNRLRKYGGGLWITKACHDFDLLNWFAGGNPKEVYATSNLSYYRPKPEAGERCRDCPIKDTCPDYHDISNATGVRYELKRISQRVTGEPGDLCLYNSDKDTFDNGIAVVNYDSDVRATYTVNVVSARGTRQMRLMGTEGAAEGDMTEGKVTFWKRHTDEKEEYDLTEEMKSGHGGADDRILSDFFHCCRTGEKPRSSWEEGRRSVQVGLAARDSCDSGDVVKI